METIKLSASERPSHVYTYSVIGYGTFPLDMLRYDQAYPLNPEAITVGGTRSVQLRSHRLPTVGRWMSFGWTVESV